MVLFKLLGQVLYCSLLCRIVNVDGIEITYRNITLAKSSLLDNLYRSAFIAVGGVRCVNSELNEELPLACIAIVILACQLHDKIINAIYELDAANGDLYRGVVLLAVIDNGICGYHILRDVCSVLYREVFHVMIVSDMSFGDVDEVTAIVICKVILRKNVCHSS